MEGDINTSEDLFDKNLESHPKKPEEPVAGPSTPASEWPSLPVPQKTNETTLLASSIQKDKKKKH